MKLWKKNCGGKGVSIMPKDSPVSIKYAGIIKQSELKGELWKE